MGENEEEIDYTPVELDDAYTELLDSVKERCRSEGDSLESVALHKICQKDYHNSYLHSLALTKGLINRLLENGANINYMPMCNRPILHNPRFELIDFLFEKEADMYVVDAYNMTALHVASSKALIDVFADKGGDFSIKRDMITAPQFLANPHIFAYGLTPLQYQLNKFCKKLPTAAYQAARFSNERHVYNKAVTEAKESINAHVRAIFLREPNAQLENYVSFSDKITKQSVLVTTVNEAWETHSKEVLKLQATMITDSQSLYALLKDDFKVNVQVASRILCTLKEDFPCYAVSLEKKLLTPDYYNKKIANSITFLGEKRPTDQDSIPTWVPLNPQCTEKILSYVPLKDKKFLYDGLLSEAKKSSQKHVSKVEIQLQQASFEQSLSPLKQTENKQVKCDLDTTSTNKAKWEELNKVEKEQQELNEKFLAALENKNKALEQEKIKALEDRKRTLEQEKQKVREQTDNQPRQLTRPSR